MKSQEAKNAAENLCQRPGSSVRLLGPDRLGDVLDGLFAQVLVPNFQFMSDLLLDRPRDADAALERRLDGEREVVRIGCAREARERLVPDPAGVDRVRLQPGSAQHYLG